MQTVRHTDPDFSTKLSELSAHASLFDPKIEERTKAILQAVAERGDAALLEFTQKFDGAKLTADQLAVTQAELFNASLAADESLRAAVAEAEKNIAGFARKSLRHGWQSKNSHGATVGEKFDPFRRVGVYIPGGTAPLVSTALMTITLAKVAGCQEVVVTTPCGKDGSVNSAILFAARTAGATEIYRLGGAQAIAALAHGTATIRRVQKIFGPGNAYVSTRASNFLAARLNMPRAKSAARIGLASAGRCLSSAMVMSPVPQQMSSTAASGRSSTALKRRAARRHHNRSTLAESR